MVILNNSVLDLANNALTSAANSKSFVSIRQWIGITQANKVVMLHLGMLAICLVYSIIPDLGLGLAAAVLFYLLTNRI